MRRNLIATFAALLLVLGAGNAFAQRGPGMMWRGSGGWGPGTPYNRMYDPNTVETISGEIVTVSPVVPNKGMASGVFMTVKTDKETISVHLGPSWYIQNQDVKLEAKDRVEVKGARITFFNQPAIIASEVRKGNEVLKLRDDDGFPIWAGWRRRS
ncbi:MAG TPA: DNA-binding protein [Candidatus Binatia bacterium]|jgi:hypothetical protein